MWESDIEVLSVEEIADMEPVNRVGYLRQLHAWQVDRGVTDGLYQSYRRYESMCKQTVDEVTGELCMRPFWGSGPHCLKHAGVDQLDPDGAEKRRKARNKARLADLAERALDFAEDVLDDVEGVKYPPSLRAKVMVEVLDREITTSKKMETHTEVSGEVTVTHTAMEVISAKLDRYAQESLSAFNQEMAEIEAEVIDEQEGDAA